MLNLSDNELDRLSREAASQHDPGDPLGPQSWERLSLRLDKELGRAGPQNAPRGFRGIRRLPFQYAPVLILVVGVAWYFVKAKGRKADSAAGPPSTAVNTPHQMGTSSDSSLKNLAYSDKSTSTLYPGSDASTPSAEAPKASASTPGPDHSASAPANNSGLANSNTGRASHGPASLSPGLDHNAAGLSGKDVSGKDANSFSATRLTGKDKFSGKGGKGKGGKGKDRNGKAAHTGDANDANGSDLGSQDQTGLATQRTLTDQTNQSALAAAGSSGPERAFIQRPILIKKVRSHISDSIQKARIDSAAAVAQSAKAGHLEIKRAFSFGFQIAPDFASVNALAGDKPGSTIGFTVDYEFLKGWHIGTGALFSRKNFTARSMDYHTPKDYFRLNGMKDVDFVKGTMNMLEIPINLRYDFSTAGNTIFFANVGASSYIFGTEHCNYYFDYFGREACRDFRYSNTPNGLFSSVNLSLGVETGISNSLSILVAPYMKLPTTDIGFGKVRMNSVGINFALRYSPISSRKRTY